MKWPRFLEKFPNIVEKHLPGMTAPGPSIVAIEGPGATCVLLLLNELEDLEDRHIHRDDHRADDAAEDQDHDGLE